jgi:FKBP-type peptidyl-prolyl cis-trans isomerase SlpA
MPSAVPPTSAKDAAQSWSGRRVTLHLGIWLDDDTEVLSTLDEEPIRFRPGDGTLAPGLESLLADLPVGTDTQLLADGSAVFGAHDPALVHRLPLSDLPADFAAEPGQVLTFDTPGGQQTAGTVLDIAPDGVDLDFNHPLSRCALRVRVQVLAID